MEKNKENGFQIRNILSLNRHWRDCLLDFLPTRLKLESKKIGHRKFMIDVRNKSESVSDLHKLKHLELKNSYGEMNLSYSKLLCEETFHLTHSLLVIMTPSDVGQQLSGIKSFKNKV